MHTQDAVLLNGQLSAALAKVQENIQHLFIMLHDGLLKWAKSNHITIDSRPHARGVTLFKGGNAFIWLNLNKSSISLLIPNLNAVDYPNASHSTDIPGKRDGIRLTVKTDADVQVAIKAISKAWK